MVRLGAILKPTNRVLSIMFQFQYGAIRSIDAIILHIDSPGFQFQYGAIRS